MVQKISKNQYNDETVLGHPYAHGEAIASAQAKIDDFFDAIKGGNNINKISWCEQQYTPYIPEDTLLLAKKNQIKSSNGSITPWKTGFF